MGGKIFKEYIKECIDSREGNITLFSKEVGISRPSIYKLINGKMPTDHIINKIREWSYSRGVSLDLHLTVKENSKSK